MLAVDNFNCVVILRLSQKDEKYICNYLLAIMPLQGVHVQLWLGRTSVDLGGRGFEI